MDADGALTIVGRGLGGFIAPADPLDAGNSGTTMRMLTGVLSGQQFVSTIMGDRSLSRRPMGRVIEPLGQMGAQIDATDGRAPLTIHGTALHAIAYEPDVPSAQVKSAVLLAGLHASGTTSVAESAETRDHTDRALAAFGATVDRRGLMVSVLGGQRLIAGDFAIPGDMSSAAFWMAAPRRCPGRASRSRASASIPRAPR